MVFALAMQSQKPYKWGDDDMGDISRFIAVFLTFYLYFLLSLKNDYHIMNNRKNNYLFIYSIIVIEDRQ